MTRPRKATVDFFPHYATHGKTLFVLDETYGIHGYYFWFRLLEMLASTDNHFIDISSPSTLRFLCAKTKTDKNKALEILNCLADMEAIDAKLWESEIIWSDKFVEGISSAYRNRMEDIPKKPNILRQKQSESDVSDVNQAKISATNERTNEPNVTNELKALSTVEPVDPPNGFKISNLAQLWNEKAPPELARVNLPFNRKPAKLKILKDILKRNPEKIFWEQLMEKIYFSSFMRGKNNRGWKATFDFVIERANEIADGKYIDNGFNDLNREEKNFIAAQQFLADMEDIPQ